MTTPNRGDFFVIELGGIFSRLIRWACAEQIPGKRWTVKLGKFSFSFGKKWKKAAVCHAGVALDANTIIEAAMEVKISPISKYNPNDMIWSTGIVPTVPKVADEAMKFLGHDYNYIGIVAIGLSQARFGITMARVTKWWWVNFLNSDSHVFCSELVERARRNAGFITDFATDEIPIVVSPQALGNLITRYSQQSVL